MTQLGYQIPENFWDVHVPADPKTLGDSLVSSPIPTDGLFNSFRPTLPVSLLGDLVNSKRVNVRGNGLCGLYAIMAQLIIDDPELKRMDHALFMEQISPIMEFYGVSKTSLIDSDVLLLIMRDYLNTYFPGYYPSFAIFSLSDNTVNFFMDADSRCYMSNLLTIVYSHNHYDALLFKKEDRSKIYLGLQKIFNK